MAGIAITRKELTASEMRGAAGKTKDARAARRILAIALVLEGWIARRRPRSAGWTDRRWGEADQETFRGTVSPPNGCTATTPRVWMGWCTEGLRSAPGG